MANASKGGGYENVSNYQNAKIGFMGMENIHHVTDSMSRVRKLVANFNNTSAVWPGIARRLPFGCISFLFCIGLYYGHPFICGFGHDCAKERTGGQALDRGIGRRFFFEGGQGGHGAHHTRNNQGHTYTQHRRDASLMHSREPSPSRPHREGKATQT